MTAQPSTSLPTAETAIILTPTDVQRLLADESHESRLEVLEKVSANYNASHFAAREKEIAEHIFRLLMKDSALKVRETLADKLKENPEAPRDVMLQLANDVSSVALPVLKKSVVLSDADLVTIVEGSHDLGKLSAISSREQVSSHLSTALVNTKYPLVVSTLLKNEGATISERSYETVIAEFAKDGAVTDALINRYPLPRAVIEQLIAQLDASAAEGLKQRYGITEDDLKKSSSRGMGDVLQFLQDSTLDKPATEKLVDELIAGNKLNPSIVMTALCRGHLYFFIVALARFAGIPVSNAEMLIADKGELGYKGLYKKSGLPESMEDAIRILLRAVRELEGGEAIPGSLHYANQLVARVVAHAGDQPIEYLPYFVALIRQNFR